MIGGSGWHYDETTDQWYWAQFLPFQPDLNHRNPAVKQEMFDIVRFWLDRGVDGFRLDIIDTVYEDDMLRDNPFTLQYFPSEEGRKRFFHDCIYTIHHPDNFQFVKELRAVLDEYSEPERFLVGEVGASLATHKKYSGDVVEGSRTDGLHMTFQFQSLNADFDASTFRHLISEYERYLVEPYIPTWVFSNHDVTRRISKLGNDAAKAKLNALLQLTARGVPFIYMGEEIGMQYLKIPLEEAEDPVAKKFSGLPRFITNFVTRDGKICLNRDGCRTPMQWNSSDNGGFSEPGGDTWLPLEPHYREINVEIQENDPSSMLTCYRRLLDIRRKHPALHSGSIQFKELGKEYRNSLLAYERLFYSPDFQQILQVVMNFSDEFHQIEGFKGMKTLLYSTILDSNPLREDSIHLQPLEGIILRIQ
jgi:oligo-1,6-glucosidase/alpha-glucosidase